MAIGITLNLSNSSFPPLPPTPPLPFRAPLRPKTSLKEPAIPLPRTRSSRFPYHYNTSFPRSFLHILSFSPKTPHGRTQTPHHAGSSASQTILNQPPTGNPCHALHSPVSVPTSLWLSSPPLRSNHIKSYSIPSRLAGRQELHARGSTHPIASVFCQESGNASPLSRPWRKRSAWPIQQTLALRL